MIGTYCRFSDLAVRRLGMYSRLWILAAWLAVAKPCAVGGLLGEPDGMFYMLMVYYFFCKRQKANAKNGREISVSFLSRAAETWFAILFTVIVEIVPAEVRSVVLGLFLFGMNNIGGNLPIVVDPIADKYNYRTALLIFFPGFVGASERSSAPFLR